MNYHTHFNELIVIVYKTNVNNIQWKKQRSTNKITFIWIEFDILKMKQMDYEYYVLSIIYQSLI